MKTYLSSVSMLLRLWREDIQTVTPNYVILEENAHYKANQKANWNENYNFDL